MSLKLEDCIAEAFAHVGLPYPESWPPIRVTQEHPNMAWKNFGNKGSILVEEAFLLYALVRMTKPKFALDAGTWMGMSAVWIAQGLRDNGFGEVVTVEHHDAAIPIARSFFEQTGYTEITLFHGGIDSYTPPKPVDFLVLDTETKERLAQFERLKPYLSDEAFVFFHDAGAIPDLNNLDYPRLWFKTIRETAVFQVKKPGAYDPPRDPPRRTKNE
jgi:predicted O-methyltransferase YrrM